MIPINLNTIYTMNWKLFLSTCRKVLGKGSWNPYLSKSWCSFTTFTSLKHNINYWSCGFPDEEEFLEDKTIDGGLWSQSFRYDDMAHLIIPYYFYWESFVDGNFIRGYKTQNLDLLVLELKKNMLYCRQTDLLIEVKLY